MRVSKADGSVRHVAGLPYHGLTQSQLPAHPDPRRQVDEMINGLKSLLPYNLVADFHQFVRFRKAALFQSGKDRYLINKYGKLAFFRSYLNFN